MTNAITKKQYAKVKDDTTISVVSFDRNGKRQTTYGGLSIFKAVDFIIQQQRVGRECLIIRELTWGETSENKKDYDQYLKDNKCFFEED